MSELFTDFSFSGEFIIIFISVFNFYNALYVYDVYSK